MSLYNSLQRAGVCNQEFRCTECKKAKVNSDRIGSGMVFVQSGSMYENYAVSNTITTIVFALCRKCCDKHTLTRLRWKWAEWQWKWSQFVWFLKQMMRHVKILK